MYEVGSFACHDADNLKIENENYVNEKVPILIYRQSAYYTKSYDLQKDGQIGIHRYHIFYIYTLSLLYKNKNLDISKNRKTILINTRFYCILMNNIYRHNNDIIALINCMSNLVYYFVHIHKFSFCFFQKLNVNNKKKSTASFFTEHIQSIYIHHAWLLCYVYVYYHYYIISNISYLYIFIICVNVLQPLFCWTVRKYNRTNSADNPQYKFQFPLGCQNVQSLRATFRQ